jgi:putative aldouronate transport system substrate-binding protein
VAVPEMMKKLEAAGMDIVLEEMQRQVDEWKVNK